MTDNRKTYDFCGTGLHVDAEDPALAQMFERGFGAFLAAEPNGLAEPVFRLRIRTETPVVPDGLPLVWTGDLPEGGHGRLFETDDRCLLAVSEACVLDIRPGLREADASLAVDGGRLFMGSASMLLIDLVLLSGNQHLLHAACLTRPGTGGAIVVCGPSGRGKTTTSIALARGGFGLMTDDASVIAFGPDSVHAWGMPRALKVHRYTAALMPWLAPLVGEWGEREEQGVALRDVGPHLHLAAPRPRTLEAVIILGSRRAEGHRLEPISKSEALIEIAVDNVAWFEVGAPQRSAKMFDAMGRTLAAVPTYRLHAGPDLDALPAFLDRLLDGASVMPTAP